MISNQIVCTVGGGSGMPVVNRALVMAGFKNINSIVTTFDSGGDTGRMRTDERGRILAFSDYWRSLISLWSDNNGRREVWEEMLRYRDGRGRNFGNIFFQQMAEKTGNLGKVDELFIKLSGANLCGQVIPVSLEPATICFDTCSGKRYQGENFLDELRMSKDKVASVWLEPEVAANPEALAAIEEAQIIIFCPGSMYGSVITNLLTKGFKKAVEKSRAKKVLIANIMSTLAENDGFDQNDYLNVFRKYLDEDFVIEQVIMADLNSLDPKLLKKVLDYYEMEHSRPIKFDRNNNKIHVKLADIAMIEEKNMRLRHSVEKLAKLFINMEI